MMNKEWNRVDTAKKLIDDFSHRTGLSGNNGTENERYLWTDAFTVHTFFGLYHTTGEEAYKEKALKLIDVVHKTLGKYHPEDEREGWISGLSEAEGLKHPTAGGLRIGKKNPERPHDESFDKTQEWDRDGQYFHYITRWIYALLQAGQETGEHRYSIWAAELMQASSKFIVSEGGTLRMYWKMSTDLSRPLVPNMGAHDPLEGLFCTESIKQVVPEKTEELNLIIKDFMNLCIGRDWLTTDPLGIGGLLLNTIRSAALEYPRQQSPDTVEPQKLFKDSLLGLTKLSRTFKYDHPARYRLAFRECGLTFGIHTFDGMRNNLSTAGLQPERLERFDHMAQAIEDFWSNSDNWGVPSWREHLNINAVSLAASLIAKKEPNVFAGIQKQVSASDA